MKLNFTLSRIQLLFMCLLVNSFVFSQSVYTFTSCGVSGSTGPTQAQANSSYAATNLAGNVTVTAGIQYWTVPTTGSYSIEAFGGQGYGAFGGRGAHIYGEFSLTAGDQLKILVGQKAGDYYLYPGTGYNAQYGGGGGSFVTSITNTPYVVAGGGGGSHASSYSTSCDGQITQNGAAGTAATTLGAGGISGMGGADASLAHGGGGFYGDGLTAAGGGKAFVNGGLGGFQYGFGGFGGGGGTTSWNNYRGGGGGGYSGGGAANNGASCCATAGGGGSFNAGTNPTNIAGVQLGNGMVVITLLQSFPNDAGISSIPSSILCNGTYPMQAIVQNFGSNLINSVTVNWSVNGVTQTPYSMTSILDTVGGMGSSSASVTLGTLVVDGTTTVKIWTSSPNSATDPANGNDTLLLHVEPFAVTANYINQINCFGGMNGVAQATSINSASPPSYSWTNGSNSQYMIGVGAGTYVLTGNDGTCIDTATIVFTQPSALSVSNSVTNISCNGAIDGAINLTISGGSPGYAVNWIGGATGTSLSTLAGGNYIFTVHDSHSCTFSDTLNVVEPSALSLSTSITPETVSMNGAIDLTVTGGSPAYTYSWSNSANTQDISGISGGTYTVTVTDHNGCTETATVVVNSVVGVQENKKDFSVQLFPNPTTGKFMVTLANADKNASIEVFDVLGNKVEEMKNVSSKTTIQLDGKNGVYFVRINNNNQSVVERIVLRQ